MSQSDFIISYAETTKHLCIYTAVAVLLIIIFIISPVSNIFFISFLAKIGIVALLAYIIFMNITKTQYFKNEYNVDFGSSDWGQVKTNVVGGYVFSMFLVMLLIAVLRHIV
jgi:hypothetical protein